MNGNRGDEDLEPLTVRIPTAVRITGLSRSRIYELILAGDLETVKVGRATLIRYGSLQKLTQGCPASPRRGPKCPDW